MLIMNVPVTYVAGFHNKDIVSKMPYSPLGKTGLRLSKLSAGGGAFGGLHTYGEYDDSEAEATIVRAIQSGINYVDTAPHYGYGKSEIFLGKVLQNIPRNAYYISTKLGRCGNEFDYSEDNVFKSFETSLKRLNISYVDMIIVHDVEFADNLDVIIEETLPAVKKIVQMKKANFIGISGYPISTLIEAINRSRINIDFILTYCRDTLIDNTLQQYLPLLQEKNIGVINAACVAMGLLTNNGPPPWHPAKEETKKICKDAANYCKEKGVELGRLALHHSLGQPGSCTCLVGMNTVSCLEANLNVLFNQLSNDENDVLADLKKRFFPPGNIHQWEGIEIDLLKKKQYNL